MRPLLPLLFLMLVAAKGGKKKGEEAPPPAPATPAPAAEPAPPPPPAEPEAPPAPRIVVNTKLNVTITYADGSTKTGPVTGLERTMDFYGDEGWTDEAGKLKFTVETGGTEKQVAWTDIKSLTIVPGKMPDEVDCTYSSDFTPWMYECTLRTTVTAVMKDGSKGNVTNRHRWRLWFSDGQQVELAVYKYTVREPDDRNLEFGAEDPGENFALYTRLQDRLRTEMKSKLVKSITLQ